MPKFPLRRAVTKAQARFVVALSAALCCVMLVVAAPVGAIETDDLVGVFQQGSHVYIDPGAEPVDETALQASVQQAGDMGYDLYIAVLGPSSAQVDNAQVRKALSDVTVATWMPDSYRISSDDICRDALNRADQQAKANVSMDYPPDKFMSAFVAALDTSREACTGGLLSGSSGGMPGWVRILLIVAAIAVALFVIFWLYSRAQDRAAETRRADEFRARRTILKDWSDTLQSPIEELREPVESSGNDEYQEMYDDAKKVADSASDDIDGAKELPDLDRAEIRIARAQMRIRDLYEALPDVSRE